MVENMSYHGFKAVPVKYNASSSVTRWFFIKQHLVRDKIPEKPVDRTVFVINVPPFCNENSLERTFSVCGAVRKVYCHDKPCAFLPPENKHPHFPELHIPFTYKVAYVVFETKNGLMKALQLNSGSSPLLLNENGTLKVGILKWVEEYNEKIVEHDVLQKEVDDFMMQFDSEEKRKEHEAEMAGKPDEEGWISVTHKSKKRAIIKTAAKRNKILQKEKVKQSQRELKNFYRFQIRESKMKHLEKLRRKFEEDKKKINAIKQSRKFKPF